MAFRKLTNCLVCNSTNLKKVNLDLEMMAKKETELKSEIIKKNEELTDSYNEMTIIYTDIKNLNKNLENKIEEATMVGDKIALYAEFEEWIEIEDEEDLEIISINHEVDKS